MSIQTRLLFAVGILTLSTLVIGSISWYWLTRSNAILEELHKSTLLEVNRSHELTKQSSVLTTSAPFLLNLTSSYLVEAKGTQLLQSIDRAIKSWQTLQTQSDFHDQRSTAIVETLKSMRSSMVLLIYETQSLSANEDSTRLLTSQLTKIERDLEQSAKATFQLLERDAIREVQLAANRLLTASHATSLISLGEYQRRFQQQVGQQSKTTTLTTAGKVFSLITKLMQGPDGLFELRISVLEHNVSARRALTSISTQANTLNVQVLALIRRSEQEIAERQEETSKYLLSAKILIAASGVGSVVTALLVALFVSGYIVRNLNSVSIAMTALAKGDIGDDQPQGETRDDEIGNLQSSFRVFRANALKLDRLNKQLVQEKALFESMFNNINDGIAVTSMDGTVLAHNPMLTQLLGNFDHEANVETDCLLTEAIAPIFRGVENNREVSISDNYQELRNQLGSVLEIRTSDLPDGGKVWLFSDTTERRRIEERLQHFQRLESLGQLTGEVAHDVNNVLCAIKTTLPVVISRRADSRAHAAAVEKVEDAVDLGSSFTQRLLAFAKKQQLTPETVEINALVAGVADLIALSLGNDVELHINHSPEPVYVSIDPLQLESALLNLCLNSAYAIGGVGTVSLSVTLSEQSTVKLTVEDNGCGMSEELLKKAIEPFYSTRRGGSGSGLGLSIVYGFIKQSGGDMQLESVEGQGTTVSLFLKETNNANEVCANGPTGDDLPTNGDSRVLIVENCEETLRFAEQLFQTLGMKTLTARSVAEARCILKTNTQFSILFTDLHLGNEETGWDLAEICMDTQIANKVIVTSGRRTELALPPQHLSSTVLTLEKPYSLDDLQAMLGTLEI